MAGRGPRSRRGCSPLTAMSSSSPTPTWRRRRTSCRGSSTRSATPTWPSAAGSSRTARTCAGPNRGSGGCSASCSMRSRPSGSRARSVTPSAASRASRRDAAQDLFARQRITSIVFDVELIYLARRRGYRVDGRADPVVRPARLADADAPGSGAAGWPGTCSGSRSSTAGSVDADDRDRRAGVSDSSGLGGSSAIVRALPVVAIVVAVVVVGAILASAGPTLGYDTERLPRCRPPACSTGAGLRHLDRPGRRGRAVLLLAAVHAAGGAVRAAAGAARRGRLDGRAHRRVRGRRRDPARLA